MTRDPRVDPQPDDIVSFRDKPQREIVQRFTDACDQEWVTYTIRKQMTVRQWKRSMRGAQIDYAGAK